MREYIPSSPAPTAAAQAVEFDDRAYGRGFRTCVVCVRPPPSQFFGTVVVGRQLSLDYARSSRTNGSLRIVHPGPRSLELPRIRPSRRVRAPTVALFLLAAERVCRSGGVHSSSHALYHSREVLRVGCLPVQPTGMTGSRRFGTEGHRPSIKRSRKHVSLCAPPRMGRYGVVLVSSSCSACGRAQCLCSVSNSAGCNQQTRWATVATVRCAPLPSPGR